MAGPLVFAGLGLAGLGCFDDLPRPKSPEDVLDERRSDALGLVELRIEDRMDTLGEPEGDESLSWGFEGAGPSLMLRRMVTLVLSVVEAEPLLLELDLLSGVKSFECTPEAMTSDLGRPAC